ncbi:hypothetical protein [Companilactobacillus nodensis]|uniref:Uncharacterized protein n=1 Tax=Companilactobacillus nodensis DSM 19682 = JCM 14932 = NBRC 107160 TaxID=1423775 RepID=A0A0R1K4S5_9LACO|nr:hypothetical protein [Companilactobacillus nodensis]KRK78575.1 hypothetical protein FD03_GL002351 [Companilactobacillus nodensis DSM 19682 = JCM 14932 = NBRC 107160]
MKMTDDTEAKKTLSELYTDINNEKDLDKDDYTKNLVLRTYNLLDKNYSYNYLFGRLKDDTQVTRTLRQMDEGKDYEEKINYLAKGANFAIY